MPKTLRVLMVEPHEAPHELLITDQLDDLQETVGGLIEVNAEMGTVRSLSAMTKQS